MARSALALQARTVDVRRDLVRQALVSLRRLKVKPGRKLPGFFFSFENSELPAKRQAMAAAVSTREPSEIFAGDTIYFIKRLSDYPSPTWSLRYRLLLASGGPDITIAAAQYNFTADFLVQKVASDTATWIPGLYSFIGYVGDATTRVQIYNGRLNVKPDPAVVSSLDGSTYLEKILKKLEDVIIEGVIRAPIRYSYGGVATEVMSLKDALDARDRVKALIIQEAALASGTQRKILTRFTSPI